jgi:signal transduction histidine kinase
MSPGDRDVLDELAAPAGVALATVRLTFELRERARQLAELASGLQACQARMVVARSDERQRLLARVETVVVPRLDETDAALRSLEETANSAEAVHSLEDARDAATASLEAVREVARGIFPNLLADAGVVAALRSWGEERVPPVGVSHTGDISRLRSMPAVEAALYFACVSALAGTAAQGPPIEDGRPETALELAGRSDARAAPTAELEVTEAADAGAGCTVKMSLPLPGATVESPTLLAIRDRIGALGGAVTVDAAPTGGGRMTVLVPLEPDQEPPSAADGVAP